MERQVILSEPLASEEPKAMKFSDFAFTLLLMFAASFGVVALIAIVVGSVLLSQSMFGGGSGPTAIP